MWRLWALWNNSESVAPLSFGRLNSRRSRAFMCSTLCKGARDEVSRVQTVGVWQWDELLAFPLSSVFDVWNGSVPNSWILQ